MQTIRYILFVTVAVAMAASCGKDGFEIEQTKGTPMIITIGNPEGSEVEAPESKVAWRVARNPKWEAGDAFQIFSHNFASTQLTNWGDFVTAEGSVTSGKSDADFSGYQPTGFTKATGGNTFTAIVKNPSNTSYSLFVDGSRYSFYNNIPAVQDGTGLKYSLFGTVPSFTDGTPGSFSSWNFNLKSALCAIKLPTGANVTTITVTLGYANESAATTQFLASKGDAQDLKWQSNFTFLGGGGSKSVTITKGGSLLPEGEPIYWACVRTQSNASKSWGLAHITFEFTNDAGAVATKVANLPDGTNINVGNKLNNFGTVTFNPGDFVTP